MSPQQIALVTGASSGIGRATALGLQAAGLETWAGVRRPESLDEVESLGLRGVMLDVTDEDSRVDAMRRIETDSGPVGVLVNNAGYEQPGFMEEVPIDAVRDEFDVNVFGLLRMSQLVLPGMRAAEAGRIINVGSVGGLFTAPGAGAYHASKYAVEAISDALRMEVRRFGVDVVLIQPTGVRTNFLSTGNALMPRTAPDGPYAEVSAAFVRSSSALFEPGSRVVVSADDVAATIVKAVTTPRPRTRYKVGWIAHVIPAVKAMLPDRAFDGVVQRQLAG